MRNFIYRMRGGGANTPRHSISWMLWSWLAAFCGIALVGLFNQLLPISATDNIFLIGSFGASAVLIYGTPHVPYSQPRNLVGGHLVSALVAVTVSQFIDLPLAFQAALSVSTAIFFMHVTNTLHPPGGATALIGIIGGDNILELGYGYVFAPVLSGALIMLVVALVINNLSADDGRHYPKCWW